MGILRRLSLILSTTALLAAAAPGEYQVKAVFLFNFSQFIEWPAQAFGAADAPFVICVVGEDPFGPQLEAAVNGESVQGHPLAVKRFRDADSISQCHILFVSEAAQLGRIRAALHGHSILVVSDIDRSAEHGAIIQFTSERNRLRLRINVAAAKTAGLTISSKLLRPAEIVGPEQG